MALGRLAVPIWAIVSLLASGCRAPGDATKEPPPKQEASPQAPPQKVELPGVDTSALTSGELEKWSSYVSELLAPCSDQPVSVAQCVKEARACDACAPAAKFLVQRVRRGNTRAQVEGAYRIRFSPEAVKPIALDDSPRMGATQPTVTIVEWADLECPSCAFAAPLLKQQVDKYPTELQLVFKHYPLGAHQHAELAARATVAAQNQGKFWQLQPVLFQNQKAGLDRSKLLQLASPLGIDMKKFESDMDSEQTADRVARDRKQAEELKLSGTPMIYINGRYFDFEFFDLREDLDDWLALEVELMKGKGKAPATPPPAATTGAAKPGAAKPGAVSPTAASPAATTPATAKK
jgi:protein-disulfide isomerase